MQPAISKYNPLNHEALQKIKERSDSCDSEKNLLSNWIQLFAPSGMSHNVMRCFRNLEYNEPCAPPTLHRTTVCHNNSKLKPRASTPCAPTHARFFHTFSTKTPPPRASIEGPREAIASMLVSVCDGVLQTFRCILLLPLGSSFGPRSSTFSRILPQTACRILFPNPFFPFFSVNFP